MDIRDFYLFTGLDEQLAQTLSKKITKKTFHKNNVVFYKGDSSDKLHMLVDGDVKLYKYNLNNEEIVLHYLSAQTLIGEMATFENIPYPANCMAENDVEIWTLPQSDFIEALHDKPELALKIITSMGRKIKILERSIDLNISKNSMQRVVTLILQNKRIFEEMPRLKIAAMLNMKQETLSRIMKKLKDEENISIEKKVITILDKTALEKILDES